MREEDISKRGHNSRPSSIRAEIEGQEQKENRAGRMQTPKLLSVPELACLSVLVLSFFYNAILTVASITVLGT